MKWYMSTLTQDERKDYIKGMNETLKTLAEEFKTSSESDKPSLARKNLDHYGLFHKHNYYKYFLSKRIIEALLSTSADTIIYGGYVRDNLFHDHMASLFYTRYMKIEGTDDDKYSLFDDYNNPTIDEASVFRTLVPQDIDVVFSRQRDYDLFVLSLQSMNFKMEYCCKCEIYTNDTTSKTRFKIKIYGDFPLQYLKCRPRLFTQEFLESSVVVDVTIDMNPTLSDKDFKCNSLKMNINGFVGDHIPSALFYDSVNERCALQKSTFDSAMEIKSQISKMEAHCFYRFGVLIVPHHHRIEKMFKKGYRLVIESGKTELQQRFEQIINGCDDCCSLCREDLEEIANVPGMHTLYNGVRFNCCSAVYHPKCLKGIFRASRDMLFITDTTASYRCIQCRQISFDHIEVSNWERLLSSVDRCWIKEKEEEESEEEDEEVIQIPLHIE